MSIRIGNAPCSWGVEFPDDPRNPNWRSVLKDCAAAGYKGIELGPVGFMPEDPAILAEARELAARGVREVTTPTPGKTCSTARTAPARRWWHTAQSTWC